MVIIENQTAGGLFVPNVPYFSYQYSTVCINLVTYLDKTRVQKVFDRRMNLIVWVVYKNYIVLDSLGRWRGSPPPPSMQGIYSRNLFYFSKPHISAWIF